MNATNINFKGFKNVISSYNLSNNNDFTAYMSMQLNDENGYSDLSTYKTIRKSQGYNEKSYNDDIITFVYKFNSNNSKGQIYLNTSQMYWGEELSELKEHCIPQYISAEKYKTEETLQLKVYTLLASLTKRIKNCESIQMSQDIKKVANSAYSTLCRTIKDQFLSYRLIQSGCLETAKDPEIANLFNQIIDRSMKKFFKF